AHAAGRAVVVVGSHARAGVVFAFLVDQAVHDLVDLGGAFAHAAHVFQDFVDRGRAGRDGHDHVLEAVLDTLGDLDLAFTGEEFDRAHLAHVHAHRIGRAPEIRIHGGQGGLGLVLDVVIAGGRGHVVAHQQGFGVRSLVVDRDPHVAERADDAVDGLGVDQVV